MKDQPGFGARLSRRDFIRLTLPTAGLLAVLPASAPGAHASAEIDPATVPAVLADVSRCVGCGNCQRRCTAENNLPSCKEAPTTLSAEVYTFIDRKELSVEQTRFVKRQCMHCLEPGCVAACPVGALHRTSEGPVVADTSKCIGCRYCQYACPFSIPRFEWDQALGVMRKCTSCLDRLEEGGRPACVAGCPSGALRFGTRAGLLAEANARIAAQPEHYYGRVYGETEAGGTSRLYISDVEFEKLGLPALGPMPVPHYAEQVMTKTPAIAAGVAAASALTYLLLGRRERGLQAKHGGKESDE